MHPLPERNILQYTLIYLIQFLQAVTMVEMPAVYTMHDRKDWKHPRILILYFNQQWSVSLNNREPNILDYQDIHTVTHKVGLSKDQLTALFYELGLPDDQVENAQRKADTTDYKLQANKVLGHWKKTKGKEATRGKIMYGLTEGRCTEAVEQLQDEYNW